MMATPMDNRAPAQRPAIRLTDPTASAFVRAHAGSGKTKTLIDRVARLLLSGAHPAAILCLTYTKAAASEMQRRLFDTLGAWATADDATLGAHLRALEDQPLAEISPARLRQARGLFARALEVPGGLKIQTLHAFAEAILHRFPLEAGLWPGFEIIDDREAARLLQSSLRTVEQRALGDEGHLGQAYQRLATRYSEDDFLDLLHHLIGLRRDLVPVLQASGGLDALQSRIWAHFGFSHAVAPDAVLQPIPHDLAHLSERMAAGSASDKTTAALLMAAGAAPDTASQHKALCDWVFTQTGGVRKNLLSKPLAVQNPALAEAMQDIAAHVIANADALGRADTAQASTDALCVAETMIATYTAAKRAAGGVDFLDLIAATVDLLSQADQAQWVLYKLDAALEHVLVDEAQDTAPEQWAIVRALTQGFFDAADGPARTLFAVGDIKQSIYGFQGARPEAFLREGQSYHARLTALDRVWSAQDLVTSYRTVPQILRFVDAFLDLEASRDLAPQPENEDRTHHIAHRTDAGSVELWPLMAADEIPEEADWLDAVDTPASNSGVEKLAVAIAERIRTDLASGCAVMTRDGHPRAMTAGDVMILVRQRGPLFEALGRAIKCAGVPVAGADRLRLFEAPVVQDLLTLARVCLNPYDDLGLATILRAPTAAVPEDMLFDLAHNRPGSLWDVLTARADTHTALRDAVDLVRTGQGLIREGPFAFFSRLLDRPVAGAPLAARFKARLGAETAEAISAFLNTAMAFEVAGGGTLAQFVHDSTHDDLEIKREMDEGHGQVRIMTIHAAKGLEAPVVILPDTAQRPRSTKSARLYRDPELGLIMAGASKTPTDAFEAASKHETRTEYLRLFYVAATRARDRLIICGYRQRNQKTAAEGSWYDLSCVALDTLETTTGADGIRRHGPATTPLSHPVPAVVDGHSPNWLHQPVSYEAKHTRRPSAGAVLSPRTPLKRFVRGTLIHTLLGLLPHIPPEQREQAGRDLLLHESLTARERVDILSAALSVLDHAGAHPLFGPDACAEVAIAGTVRGQWVEGRVDRLVVTADEILLGDIKTNRPGAASLDEIDPGILYQLGLYAEILRAAYPHKTLSVYLVWTDGPHVMPVPLPMLRNALTSTTTGE